MNSLQKEIFSCLDKIRAIYPNQQLAFVDAYQDDGFLGGCGTFIDCIPNATAYHHSGFGKRIRDYSGQIVICCQLVNSEGRFRAFIEQGNTETFFGKGRSKLCLIWFVDVPYQDKADFFPNTLSSILCDYQKLTYSHG